MYNPGPGCTGCNPRPGWYRERRSYHQDGADHTPTKEIDQVAEDCILRFLQDHPTLQDPDIRGSGEDGVSRRAGTIFLDPIDGTYNAVAGIPFYALSIAYAEEGIVLQGFVHDLSSGETFTAIRGKGARLNRPPGGRIKDLEPR